MIKRKTPFYFELPLAIIRVMVMRIYLLRSCCNWIIWSRMNLYRIRGGNEGELRQKEYTIGIGISLGNKWFNAEKIADLVKWALSYGKNHVIVYVVDSIHAINIEVRNKVSFKKALDRALLLGDTILREAKEKIEEEFSQEDANRVLYAKWKDIADDSYKKKVDYLMELYGGDVNFKNAIHLIVKGFVSKETRTFSEEKINRLGMYVIEELPEIINRVPMKGIVCDAYVYPFDGELTQFAEKIQNGEIFPQIKENIMDTEPKVFLEVR